MKLLDVFSTTQDTDDAIIVDALIEDNTGLTERMKYAYRPSDNSVLTNLITEWLDNNQHEILPYTLPPELTPEELRAQMPVLTPRQFRDALIDEDIMPDHVTAAISQIPDEKQRAKALNAWEYPTQFMRTDPLIDQIGAMFSLTPEQIDAMWLQALEA